LAEKNITFSTDIAILEINGKIVKGINVYSNEMVTFDDYDTIVLVTARISCSSLFEPLKGRVNEVYCVGDALAPRRTDMAIREAHLVGRSL